jgi:hypothetical protein
MWSPGENGEVIMVKNGLVAVLCAMALTNCTMTLSDLEKTEPTTPVNTYDKRPDLAQARCDAFYAGVVSTDVATTRRSRNTVTTISALVSGTVAAVTAFIAASQANNASGQANQPSYNGPSTGTLVIAGSTAFIAAATPLTGLILNLFDQDFSALNSDQQILESYLDTQRASAAPRTQPPPPAAPPGSTTPPAPTFNSTLGASAPPNVAGAAADVESRLTQTFGGQYRNDVLNPCIDRLSNTHSVM